MRNPKKAAPEQARGGTYECAWKPTNFFGGVTSRISLKVLEDMISIYHTNTDVYIGDIKYNSRRNF